MSTNYEAAGLSGNAAKRLAKLLTSGKELAVRFTFKDGQKTILEFKIDEGAAYKKIAKLCKW